MAQEARIKLTSTNLPMLESVCSEIKGIGEKNGISLRGTSSSSDKENESCDKEISLWSRDKYVG